MTPSEAAILLTFAAAFDRRTVGEADAEAWALALPDVQLHQAKDAVVEHYRNTRDFMMPSDVNDIVRRLRAALRAKANYACPPDDLADEKYPLWLRAFWAAIEDGQSQEDSEAIAAQSVGASPWHAPLELDSSKLDAAVEATKAALMREDAAKPKPRVIRRPPTRWAAERGLQIVDPHNWDGDFRGLCTEDEFDERLGGVMTKPFEQATEPLPAPLPNTPERQPRDPAVVAEHVSQPEESA